MYSPEVTAEMRTGAGTCWKIAGPTRGVGTGAETGCSLACLTSGTGMDAGVDRTPVTSTRGVGFEHLIVIYMFQLRHIKDNRLKNWQSNTGSLRYRSRFNTVEGAGWKTELFIGAA